MSVYLKDPQAVVDYTLDWDAGYLGTDTITTSTWSVTPVQDGGLVVDADSKTDTTSTVTVSGGVVGHVYRATNSIVMASGLHDERSVTLLCMER